MWLETQTFSLFRLLSDEEVGPSAFCTTSNSKILWFGFASRQGDPMAERKPGGSGFHVTCLSMALAYSLYSRCQYTAPPSAGQYPATELGKVQEAGRV